MTSYRTECYDSCEMMISNVHIEDHFYNIIRYYIIHNRELLYNSI